jgi:hypothetical protein
VDVDPGSGPDRDDAGLPRVDVEIPDDARELDRDVQAYYREQRAQQRRLRSLRVRRALTRDGMVLPLLACCLIFALITGTVLTLFSATSIDQGLPGTAGAGRAAAGSGGATPAVTSAPGELARASVAIGGQARSIRSLGPAVLLVESSGCPCNGAVCSCNGAIAVLASLASEHGARPYLVTTQKNVALATAQATQLSQKLLTATDTNGSILGAGYPHAGLTAIIVGPSGRVTYAQHLQDTSGGGLAAMLTNALA